jgi:hypothetical protein
MKNDFYWFDKSSKEWGVFALFLLSTQKGEVESAQNHVEWLDARYDSPNDMIAGVPSRIVGTPRLSPEYVKLWGAFHEQTAGWSRKRIKTAVEMLQFFNYWHDRFDALPVVKKGKAA